jgi:hypothetical protein
MPAFRSVVSALAGVIVALDDRWIPVWEGWAR